MRREKNILQSIKEGKKYPAHPGCWEKKKLADQKSPTPPPPPQELNGRPLSFIFNI